MHTKSYANFGPTFAPRSGGDWRQALYCGTMVYRSIWPGFLVHKKQHCGPARPCRKKCWYLTGRFLGLLSIFLQPFPPPTATWTKLGEVRQGTYCPSTCKSVSSERSEHTASLAGSSAQMYAFTTDGWNLNFQFIGCIISTLFEPEICLFKYFLWNFTFGNLPCSI